MAIPNLYHAISYPDIKPTTPNDTLWATVAPYEQAQREALNRDVIRQNMALAQTGEERAQKRLELEQAQEGRAQKQEGRVEREFEEKESDWERKAGLREAVIGAAQKAKGDPLQTLINLQNVHFMSGEAGLGLEIQSLAPKLIEAMPDYESKARAWGVMGVQVTPAQLAAQDAKASGSADGGSVYTPGKGFEFFQSPQGAQEATLKQQELDLRRQALTQSGRGDIIPGRTAKDAINIQNLGRQNEDITKQHDEKMEFLMRAAQNAGLDLEQQYEWVKRKMNADPQVRRGRQQIIDNVKMANAINAKAEIVAAPIPDFGTDGQEDITGADQELDSFLVGAGVRKPGGQVATGGMAASAPAQVPPPAPNYVPTPVPGNEFQGPYRSFGSVGGAPPADYAPAWSRSVDLSETAEGIRRGHMVLQEQALARLEANPELFMSYVQSTDPDLQEAARTFQQRVMQAR